MPNTQEEKNYWSKRYQDNKTGWDIGAPSTPLKVYIDQITNKDLKILIPGAGNSYEAEYLFNNGFKNVYVLDIANAPLKALLKRVPNFPLNQLIEGNFFEYNNSFDLIFEQTFFCSFPPTLNNRKLYAKKINSLLKPKGKLVGVWFNIPLTRDMEKRPFGGTKEEYLSYFSPYFKINTFEKCYNSIAARQDNELFGIFQKK
jgi:thiopurine S-methyltransferase